MRHEIVVMRDRDFCSAFVFGRLSSSIDLSRPLREKILELGGIPRSVKLKALRLGPVRLVYTCAEDLAPLVSHQLMLEGLEALDSFWVDDTHFAGTRNFRARASDERRQFIRCLDEMLLPSDEPDSPVLGFLSGTPFAVGRKSRLLNLELTG